MGIFHINKVNQNHTRQITKPELPCNFQGRFPVDLFIIFFCIFFTAVFTGVDIDGNKGFCLLNYQKSTGF